MEYNLYKANKDRINAFVKIFANVRVEETSQLPQLVGEEWVHSVPDNERGVIYVSYEFLNLFMLDTSDKYDDYFNWQCFRLRMANERLVDKMLVEALQRMDKAETITQLDTLIAKHEKMSVLIEQTIKQLTNDIGIYTKANRK